MTMGLPFKNKQNPPTDLPAHTPGIKQGNSTGNYDSQAGHQPDGRRTPEASTGINPKARGPIDPRMPSLTPG
jgi:hypothetical protein